jgi:hypothetical protein
MQDVPWAHSRPVISWLLSWHYHRNYGIRLVLLWRLGMRPHRVLGSSMIFPKGHKWACWKIMEFGLLMPHELTHEQNRIAIVNSVITKIFNPCKHWTVTIFPPTFPKKHLTIQCLFCSMLVSLFNLCSFSAFVRFSDFVWLFSVPLFFVFSVLILE